MVYSYACDECVLWLHKTSKPSTPISPPWAKLERQSLGLTQVCTQIRQELLPLFRHQVRPVLTHLQIFDYISNVFPETSTAFGTLLVCFPFFMNYQDRIDLKPLIDLITSALDLHLEFRVSSIPPRHFMSQTSSRYIKHDLLNTFLGPQANKECLKRAAKLCKNITFSSKVSYIIRIEGNAENSQPWMWWNTHAGGDDIPLEGREWFRSIGLDLEGTQSWKGVVKVSGART